MEPIPESGLYYPNKIARIALHALEDVMGKNGVNAILNLANLQHLLDNPPLDNLQREFDFAYFSSIWGALEEMYGPRGGRGLALRAGRATFDEGLRNFGVLAGAGDLAFKVLPLQTKLKIGLPAMARIFTQTSDQHSTVEERDDHYIYTIHKCPCCYGRQTDKASCFVATGLIQEGLKWVSGGHEFRVNESLCMAVGDEVCEFVVMKEPIG
ncbi:MAG: 4-vinyl reductase [Chloroflexi bacterium HGW-Chloroflexi-10]|jgi:predicted hydrocarbon binding protein|nr:MAG: 4-vinyl reductase [Chloroflexi bacterium HGW-Chloroflexi-10]